VQHHGAGLRKLTGDPALVDALSQDYRQADLSPADRAMLDYVAKLTIEPAAEEKADIVALRQAGFDDRAIHDICNVAAYYAYVNRIADGLGVELEPFWEAGE
jgi:uncharacterized peroxidase-related enzyme